ncbi:hypothetical protein UFOVP672_8 [uncultured Caudovirales phage]|uniref:Uncharacterized protein n=1 Tax=uncultured Caudovirales phage TaxID=2100421 RepID=A0A6J5NA28_9CAUD|nr:hypothetical protein UFOVP672_8 [uncultured Caudovirales phage]
MKIYYCATSLILFAFSLLACALNVADLADLPWALVLVLDLAALVLLIPCACRALRVCLCCLAVLIILPGCQALRDSMQAARINQNLEQTDALLQHYSTHYNK